MLILRWRLGLTFAINTVVLVIEVVVATVVAHVESLTLLGRILEHTSVGCRVMHPHGLLVLLKLARLR